MLKKKLLAMLLVLMMAFTCLTACGDDEDKDDDKNIEESGDKNNDGQDDGKDDGQDDGQDDGKDDEKTGYKDIYEVLAAGCELKAGTVNVVMDMNMDGTEGKQVAKMEYTVETNGKDAAKLGIVMSMDQDGVAMEFDLPELLIVVDKVMYINLGAVVDVVENMGMDLSMYVGDAEFSWFAIPLPDDMPETVAVEGLEDSAVALVKAMLAGAESTVDGDTHTVAIKDAAGVKTAMGALADFIEKDAQGMLESYMGVASDVQFDLNAYVEKLANFYRADLVAIFEAMEMPDAETSVDAMIEGLLETDYNTVWDEMEGTGVEDMGIDFAETAAEIRSAMEEVTDEEMPENFVASISASLKDKTLTVSGELSGKDEEVDLTAKFEATWAEKDVTVSAPADQCYLRDYSDLIVMLLMSSMQ